MSYNPLHGKNSVEHVVPHLARHTEAELEVLVVVREVVLLHLTDVRGELRVVQPRKRSVSHMSQRKV